MAETPTWAPLVADIIDPGAWSRNKDAFIDEMLARSRCGVGFSVSGYSESATVIGYNFVGDAEPSVSTQCDTSDENIAKTIRRALAAFYVLAGVDAPASVKGGGDV